MSKRVKSVLALSLVLVLSLTLAACNGGGPATSTVPTQTEPTQVDAAQLVAQASSATSAVDTSKFDMNMTMVMEVVGGTDPGKMTILFNAKGAMDNKDREMILATDMNMDIPGQGAQAAITEFYAVGDWIYIKMSVPGSDDQWMKTAMTEEIWTSQNQFAQQLALLTSAEEVSFVGRESVRGVECNVIEIAPSTEAIIDLLAQQSGGTQDIFNFEQLLQTGLAGTAIKAWIAVDSNLLMKSFFVLSMEGTPGDFGVDEGAFDKMTMDINLDFEAYDYNQPVTIDLPPEALNAQEVSG